MTAKAVAILPFADQIGGKSHVCDGLMEILIDAAERTGIPCAPRPRAAVYKDPAVDLKAVAAALQCELIMTGKLAQGADGKSGLLLVRLTAAREAHLLYERNYALVDNGIQLLLGKVLVDLLAAVNVPRPENVLKQFIHGMSASGPALDMYLRGLQAVHGRLASSNRDAIECLSKAVALDPQFARAHVRLSEAYAKQHQYFTAHDTGSLNAALDAARTAVSLAPDLAEAQWALGVALTLSKDFIKAGDTFERAHTLDPHLYGAWYDHARCCFQQGLLKEAAVLFEKASEVRPFDYQSVLLLRQVYLSLGELDKATKTAQKGIRLATEQIKLYPDEARAYYLACGAMMQLGLYREAVEWAAKALAIDPEDATINYNVACCYAQIGEYDKALECLEKAVGFGLLSAGWVKNDSDLFSLHGNPRFQHLLQSLTDGVSH